jgi:hypothetical protein
LAADVVVLGAPGADWLIAASLIPFAWAGGLIGLKLGDRMARPPRRVLAILLLDLAGLYTLAAAAHSALW